MAEYQRHLEPILRCANALAFVDPHLDPTRPGYRKFADLLVGAGDRSPPPLIELHRVCYEGSGRNRQFPNIHDFEGGFRRALSQTIQTAGLRVEVYIWDDFHDRYLISNLIGVSLPNGFDTTNNSKDITTWTRIDSRDRDDIQREFDPASRRHILHGQFSIP